MIRGLWIVAMSGVLAGSAEAEPNAATPSRDVASAAAELQDRLAVARAKLTAVSLQQAHERGRLRAIEGALEDRLEHWRDELRRREAHDLRFAAYLEDGDASDSLRPASERSKAEAIAQVESLSASLDRVTQRRRRLEESYRRLLIAAIFERPSGGRSADARLLERAVDGDSR